MRRKAGLRMGDLLTMSKQELTRHEVMQRLNDQRLRQPEAATILSLSLRQVKRLWRAYRRAGVKGLLSKRRGRPSNHQLPAPVKAQALALIRQHYPDFGPTLAHEKLVEVHALTISRESVRQLMIAEELWRPHRARQPVLHQMRLRRAALGELVQIDGSPHDWFEGRAPRCTLLVFIDDATGRLLMLWFVPEETTFAYFEASKRYFLAHGKPVAFYSDRDSIFRINKEDALSGSGLTQFGRAMRELEIEIICANSPQAKGRV
jgi:transposase